MVGGGEEFAGLRALGESAPVGVFLADAGGRCLYGNALARKWLGCPREFAGVCCWFENLHPADLEPFRSAWEALVGEGTGLAQEVRVRAAGFPDRWLDVKVVPLEPGREGQAWFLGVAVDLSRRIEAEQALREREEFLSAVFENIPAMEFVKDAAELRFVRFNKASEAQLGITRAEMYGKNDYDFFEPSQAAFFIEKDREVLRNKTLVDIPEEPIQTRDRGQRILHTKKIPILDEHGNPRYLLGISEDITERRRAQEELRLAKEAADQANVAKSKFLANMSHEIRTPLNAMLGFTQVLLHDVSLGPEQKEFLGHIMSSGEHLLTLINDVLEMAKIEAGRHRLSLVDFDLAQVLTQIASMFRGRVDPAVVFRLELADGLVRQIVADRDRLSRMVINLVANAVRFTRAGYVLLRAETVARGPERLELNITVEDTGTGIAAGDLERIFRPFEQAEGARQSGGTGLGLTLSRQYAQLMGGRVEVESTLGAGSRFRLTVPVEVAVPSHDAPAPGYQISGLEPGQPIFKVLVVDDEPANRDLLKAVLQPLGFVLATAECGDDALTLAQEWHPNVIFMDLRMPGMDGVEATKLLKSTPSLARIPVVAITAGAFEEERREALEAGADEFIRKPFRRNDILATLGQLLGIRWRFSAERPARGALAG